MISPHLTRSDAARMGVLAVPILALLGLVWIVRKLIEPKKRSEN